MTLSPRAIEVGARALCIAAGDDPDKMTYAHEMACTGRDREPKYRWQYWAEFAEAAICAALAAEGYVVAPREPTTQQMEAAGNAVAEYAKKMTQAGGDVDAMDYALRAVIYRAMIAAAQEISNASD